MDKTTQKWVLAGVILIATGFIVGRLTTKSSEKIKYVNGKTIHDTIVKPAPYLVEVPANPTLPIKFDTIRLPGDTEYVFQVVDTAQIIFDYIKKNSYREILFDNDTLGAMVVEIQVQYNELQKLGYAFTPIQKQVTIERKKVFTPFISASVSSFGIFEAGGGLYYNNTGFELKYMTDFNKNGIELGMLIKF